MKYDVTAFHTECYTGTLQIYYEDCLHALTLLLGFLDIVLSHVCVCLYKAMHETDQLVLLLYLVFLGLALTPE
jgi:hypothetical protein